MTNEILNNLVSFAVLVLLLAVFVAFVGLTAKIETPMNDWDFNLELNLVTND
jgi:hypothetical protein